MGQPPGQCSQFASSQKALWFHILWINGCNMSRCSSWDSRRVPCGFVTHLPNPSYVLTCSHIVYLVSFTWIKPEYAVHKLKCLHTCLKSRCTSCTLTVFNARHAFEAFGNTLFHTVFNMWKPHLHFQLWSVKNSMLHNVLKLTWQYRYMHTLCTKCMMYKRDYHCALKEYYFVLHFLS